jgi:tRNA threonylcarbamoyladenosine biosynthesis protein TsaE
MLDAGRSFASRLGSGALVTISGGLGAGKTLFCKGVLQGLGFDGDVPSPTFNIVNHYMPPDVQLAVIHADLYRLNDAAEIDELGLMDGESDAAVRLIEWPEQGGGAFNGADFSVRIETIDEQRRDMTIEAKEA